MTKQEYKIICKLIDFRTSSHSDIYGTDYYEIDGEDISKLKADIKELLIEEKNG